MPAVSVQRQDIDPLPPLFSSSPHPSSHAAAVACAATPKGPGVEGGITKPIDCSRKSGRQIEAAADIVRSTESFGWMGCGFCAHTLCGPGLVWSATLTFPAFDAIARLLPRRNSTTTKQQPGAEHLPSAGL
ncbi:hypothetical protein CCMA1212_002288 [Trichoderma ghanense]|uniref:SSCRP protein n=1 Tax=Trichoderma ghanense TaxID=65468 RepID=A0ABY2HF33_9HYPO